MSLKLFRSVRRISKVSQMHREQVQELETLVEQALVSVSRQSAATKGLSRNQLSPNAKTIHLMAKAAVTVLEATETEGN